MNQSIKKNSIGSKPGQQPQSSINTNMVRPKRCYNCQKMIAPDKYQQHQQSCYRFKQAQKSQGNASRAVSMANNSGLSNKTPTLNSTQSRIINNSQYKTSRPGSNSHKSRLIVNNNVVVPGKATSNITRKGPHKNIINTNIGQRKFKKSQNPQQTEIKNFKQEEKIEIQAEHKIQSQGRKSQLDLATSVVMIQQNKQQQKKQQAQPTSIRPPSSRNIRTHSRPGSATRPNMQMRVMEQNARLADFYNSNLNRRERIEPRMSMMQPTDLTRRVNQRKASLSSQSGYESSQLIQEQDQVEKQRIRENQIQRQQERARQRQRQIQQQRQRQAVRQRQLQIIRQRQRVRQIERERQRQQRERQREIQRQLQRQRQREREIQRQRQREQQQNQPRANLDLLISTTNQILHFVQQLALHDEGLTDMMNQLRQLNAISVQIRQLNGLGRNLGFRMGVVFAQRIQQLQTVIMNQIGVVLIRNFQNNISADFQRLISLQMSQPLVINVGFKRAQIDQLFPLVEAAQYTECSICLQQIEQGQQIRQLQCKHPFHPDCIQQWFKNSRKCPMCRCNQNPNAQTSN